MWPRKRVVVVSRVVTGWFANKRWSVQILVNVRAILLNFLGFSVLAAQPSYANLFPLSLVDAHAIMATAWTQRIAQAHL
jgi:hypothetical protein